MSTTKIYGAGGVIPQSDWKQQDPTKMDYIHNKPDFAKTFYVDYTYFSEPLRNNEEIHCVVPMSNIRIEGFMPGENNEGAQNWSILFTLGSNGTVEIPSEVKWAYAEPIFTPGKSYWLSFMPFCFDQYFGVWTVIPQ